jgi:hypothetical protein
MRLLHARKVQLEEFSENAIPPYSILSHTWEGDEVSFYDMQHSNFARKEGYLKIKYSCDQALKDGINYVWVDTCCIDKSSSAELSEAINSMFRWYRDAKTCYAYLSDVPPHSDPLSGNSAFPGSRWFTRGWTLQELIAPTSVYFYTAQWTCIGTKESLSDKIASITGIPGTILRGSDCRNESVARRMSWVSRRITTRKEDIAYCLLGIFGVNMPMLYGEGERAFIRLQEEILKESDDQSLFAWGTISPPSRLNCRFRGVLAKSPSEFATSSRIIPIIRSAFSSSSSPHTIISKGLRIKLPIHVAHDGEQFGLLNCHYENDLLHVLAIPLRRVGPDEFITGQICTVSQDLWRHTSVRKVYLRKDVPQLARIDDNREHGFLVKEQAFYGQGYRLSAVYPHNRWNSTNRTIFPWPDSYDSVRRRGYRHALLLFQNEGELDVFMVLRSQAVASLSSPPRKIVKKLDSEREQSTLACLALLPLLLLDSFWPMPLALIDYDWSLLPSSLIHRTDELLPRALANSLWKIFPLARFNSNRAWCGAAYKPDDQTLEQLWYKYNLLKPKRSAKYSLSKPPGCAHLGSHDVFFTWKKEMVMEQGMFVIETKIRSKGSIDLLLEKSKIPLNISGLLLIAALRLLIVMDYRLPPFAFVLIIGWILLTALACYLAISDNSVFELTEGSVSR